MLPKKEIKMVKVKVLRPFLLDGKRVEINDTIELEAGFALEMVSAAKASYDLDAKPLKRDRPAVKSDAKK